MQIFFSVGEPSGDLHAGRLISELRRQRPWLQAVGLGGPNMQRAGCQLLYPLVKHAVVGLAEALPQLWQMRCLLQQVHDYLKKHRPDVVVVVDYPGFNWHVARLAKGLKLPVVYYLPPQLWAWAPWRIRKVRKYVDLVLSGLPFEAEWYAQRRVPVLYVGHPFFDEVAERELDAAFLKEWTTDEGATVALLPGSREHEVRGCWPLLLEAAVRVSGMHPTAQFLVANYNEPQREYCRRAYEHHGIRLPITFFVGRTSEVIELADCALMVSGSVSLELLARKTPASVVYRCSWPTYLIGRCLLTCDSITLPNLIARRKLFPERVSVGNPEPAIRELVHDVHHWLSFPRILDECRAELEKLYRAVYQPGASRRVADILLQVIDDRRVTRSAA
ncbi:MAG: lipid-A-disaccharide synthase [Planctomycetaceae bacterium]|nr:MAG: lipid-A-disaccharide synthase [Planctomycetaceae bacterium]